MSEIDVLVPPKIATFAYSRVPLVGALLDYIVTSADFMAKRNFIGADKLNRNVSKGSISAPYMGVVCLFLGLVSNVKLEVVTFDEGALPKELHHMLISQEDHIYVDDIDASRVMWYLEASDVLVVVISTALVFASAFKQSPTKDYMYLPWLGAALRGVLTRQAPTAGALLYTLAVVDGTVNPLFLTALSLLFILEARVWTEIARIVFRRWEHRDKLKARKNAPEVETLWSYDSDVQSVEVNNYIY